MNWPVIRKAFRIMAMDAIYLVGAVAFLLGVGFGIVWLLDNYLWVFGVIGAGIILFIWFMHSVMRADRGLP